MKKKINFNSLRTQIDLYLDNQLSPKDQEKIISQVNQDPLLKKELNQEESFRKFIKNNVKRTTVAPDFQKTILNKLKE